MLAYFVDLFCILFFISVTFSLLVLDAEEIISSFNCNRDRFIFNDTYGTISSGDKEYPMDSHCEWLIKASPGLFITLKFTKMDTECSYDHVYIYDGDSYTSPLLGSFSGNNTPPLVTATHGSMLILLYSDTNYVRSGFEAIYSVTNCPLNCSNQGQCINHHCVCDMMWYGNACEENMCPSECSASQERGECISNSSLTHKCKCKPGYSGMDCSLPDSNKGGGNTWHLLANDVVTARAGHSGTYVPVTDSFYVFGGYTFRKLLNDTIAFEFTSNRWIHIKSKISPSARHGHAAVAYEDSVIIFGGELENRILSNELWLLNVSNHRWTLKIPSNKIALPPVKGHSCTLVDSEWLYVLGGSLSDGRFSSVIYRINVHDLNVWEVIQIHGSKPSYRRLVGHSAVYHHQTKTIFVFGGVVAEYSHISKLSNNIFAFHIENKYWTKIKYLRNEFSPLERAFHTAAIVGDYMLVYGGYTHKHMEAEICYDNETHMYHLQCHKWVDVSSLKKDFVGDGNPIKQGFFSHAMDLRRGHTLLIFGGYSGFMQANLLAYVLPTSVVSDQSFSDLCSKHTYLESCEANLACGWCFDENVCMERKNGKFCSKFSTGICLGFCSAFSTCQSCLVWSQSPVENAINVTPFPATSCAWCAQDLECHSVHDSSTTCSQNSTINNERSILTMGSANWWSSKVSNIFYPEDCYTKSFQPGIISVKHRHPINWSQPDDVDYLSQTSEDIFFRLELQQNSFSGAEENIVKFLGYLHPLGAKPLSERMSQLQLYSCSADSKAVFRLSNDSTFEHLV